MSAFFAFKLLLLVTSTKTMMIETTTPSTTVAAWYSTSTSLIQLSVNGYYVSANSDGLVAATRSLSRETLWSRLESRNGEIMLRSPLYCFFVCINDCGQVYSVLSPNKECRFIEHVNERNYTSFHVHSNGMFLGVKRPTKLQKATLSSTIYGNKKNETWHNNNFIVVNHTSAMSKTALITIGRRCSDDFDTSRLNTKLRKKCKIERKSLEIVEVNNEIVLSEEEETQDNIETDYAHAMKKKKTMTRRSGTLGDRETYETDDALSIPEMIKISKDKTFYNVDEEPEIEIMVLPDSVTTMKVMTTTTPTTTTTMSMTMKSDRLDRMVEKLLNVPKDADIDTTNDGDDGDGDDYEKSSFMLNKYIFKDCKFIKE
ncbi:fgf [Hemileuca sp. nucleopolyhedrovirus]|uniref:Fgf n=1 Tax=Hemileuca sp. nucleopolyhedrovirus TaxID=1367203 RepID=S5MQJ9_9ABAC|nr:fgf [Hemileuca sp. nucleopolyhedrovirus]AGR56874.1 fgf [Hemileuca sp. nucleopolyhedrovirus]